MERIAIKKADRLASFLIWCHSVPAFWQQAMLFNQMEGQNDKT
jgi:hypothetical protein